MNRIASILLLAVASAFAVPASAGLVSVSLVPSVTKIHRGENLFVDINIAGLQSGGKDNLLGAWSLDLMYDSNFFLPLPVPPAGWGDRLGDPFLGTAVSVLDTSTPGVASMYMVSLLGNSDLDALQRDSNGDLLDSFRLATFGFYAPLDWTYDTLTTTFATANIVFGDALGDPLTDASGAQMPIQHLPTTIPVSAPPTWTLAALAALAGLGLSRRRSTADSRRGA